MCCQREANNWEGNKLSKLKLGYKPILHNFQLEVPLIYPRKTLLLESQIDVGYFQCLDWPIPSNNLSILLVHKMTTNAAFESLLKIRSAQNCKVAAEFNIYVSSMIMACCQSLSKISSHSCQFFLVWVKCLNTILFFPTSIMLLYSFYLQFFYGCPK